MIAVLRWPLAAVARIWSRAADLCDPAIEHRGDDLADQAISDRLFDATDGYWHDSRDWRHYTNQAIRQARPVNHTATNRWENPC